MTTMVMRSRSSVTSQYIACLVPQYYRIADFIATLTASVGKMKLDWLVCLLNVLLQGTGNIGVNLQSVVQITISSWFGFTDILQRTGRSRC